jgi:carboxyl-terminal processing protease
MPRRNLSILFVVMLASVLCYQRVQKTPYGRVFADALGRISGTSLEPVAEPQLFEGAMDGMLRQLDEHSAYFPPNEVKGFDESLNLQFAGVGIEIDVDPATRELRVLSPLADSPASRAGILAGDLILRIDGTPTLGMSRDDASNLLRGEAGKPVTLLIRHENANSPEEVALVREVIQIQSVLGDTRDAEGHWRFLLEGRDRIGYVRISGFTDKTVDELGQAIASLKSEGMRGLVLDLRDNPGGYLDAGIGVCNLFVKSGAIVSTRRRDGRVSKSYSADGRAPFTDFPIAVLVNQQTASAAEIVAACLQDDGRAAVVGQRTYGKGTVQEVIYLEQDCGAMKLTTASYWRPSGKNIHRLKNATAKDAWGVSPDDGCKIALDNDEFARWQAWRADRDLPGAERGGQPNAENKKPEKPFVDRQLARAVEWVEEKLRSEGTVKEPRINANECE